MVEEVEEGGSTTDAQGGGEFFREEDISRHREPISDETSTVLAQPKMNPTDSRLEFEFPGTRLSKMIQCTAMKLAAYLHT